VKGCLSKINADCVYVHFDDRPLDITSKIARLARHLKVLLRPDGLAGVLASWVASVSASAPSEMANLKVMGFPFRALSRLLAARASCRLRPPGG
jgi:hypothetical protein